MFVLNHPAFSEWCPRGEEPRGLFLRRWGCEHPGMDADGREGE